MVVFIEYDLVLLPPCIQVPVAFFNNSSRSFFPFLLPNAAPAAAAVVETWWWKCYWDALPLVTALLLRLLIFEAIVGDCCRLFFAFVFSGAVACDNGGAVTITFLNFFFEDFREPNLLFCYYNKLWCRADDCRCESDGMFKTFYINLNTTVRWLYWDGIGACWRFLELTAWF